MSSLKDRRAALAAAVERAIAVLDIMDGDVDLEEGGDSEPGNLAQPEGVRYVQVTRRAADGRALATRLTDPLDQTNWGRGDTRDLEDQCEDEGGACEDEGFESDREAEQGDLAVNYARLADGTEDHTRPLLWGSF